MITRKDGEIEVPLKSSAVRKNNLKDLVIVKEERKPEPEAPKEESKKK